MCTHRKYHIECVCVRVYIHCMYKRLFLEEKVEIYFITLNLEKWFFVYENINKSNKIENRVYKNTLK